MLYRANVRKKLFQSKLALKCFNRFSLFKSHRRIDRRITLYRSRIQEISLFPTQNHLEKIRFEEFLYEPSVCDERSTRAFRYGTLRLHKDRSRVFLTFRTDAYK